MGRPLLLSLTMGQQGYTHGDFGWTQLTTTNTTEALKFYSALVSWEIKGEPVPDYHVIGRGDEGLGGITNMKPDDEVPGWMPYITVDDLDATLAKVEGLGGTIHMPAMPLPNDGGRIAIITDPQGV